MPFAHVVTLCARKRGRGDKIGLSVNLCASVCVCPPLVGLFAHVRHLQELIQLLAGRSWRKMLPFVQQVKAITCKPEKACGRQCYL